MKNNELKILVDRLERIFPHLRLYYEGETFYTESSRKSGKISDIEKLSMECEFAPPMEYDWYDFIKILKDNGLEIKKSSTTQY
jgi:hypothetical protein